jgi:hypothetical protein
MSRRRAEVSRNADLRAPGMVSGRRRSRRQYLARLREGVTAALDERDRAFGDYRAAPDDG